MAGAGQTNIFTGGGAFISGTVDTGGGNFAGRDYYDFGKWEPLPPYDPPPLPDPDENGVLPIPEPGPLPPGSHLPYGRNPLFTGREDELRALAKALLYEPGSAPVAATAVISTGIGGVGKTQLAVEFAHRYGRFFPGGVSWVSLAEAEGVPAAVALAGAKLQLRPGYHALPVEAQVELTQQAWESATPRLLVFDNCEDPALLEAWRPKSGGARALVTSRVGRWPKPQATNLPLETLPREQSVALLRQYAGDAAGEDVLGQIAAELGDLPLALHLAGSYLAYLLETLGGDPTRRAADLLERLRDPALLQHPALTGTGTDYSPTGHELDVGRTFALSYDRLGIDTDETGALAGTLLAVSACLAPGEPFPAWLANAAMDVGGGEAGELALAAAWKRLVQAGLLEQVGDGNCRLHKLVARFAATALAVQMTEARAAVERAAIYISYELGEKGFLRLVWIWQVHFRHLVDVALSDSPTEIEFQSEESRADLKRAATLAGNYGGFLRKSGILGEALSYYEGALSILEKALEVGNPIDAERAAIAVIIGNIGLLLQDMGDLAGARPHLEQALAVKESVFGLEDASVATSLNNLGNLLREQGDLVGAWSYLEQALDIWEKKPGQEDLDKATGLNNLGILLLDKGDPTGAQPYLEKALIIREEVLGREHEDTAQSVNNLGTLFLARGELGDARSHYERALGIWEKKMGPEHSSTAQGLINLGAVLYKIGDLAEARPYMERAAIVCEEALGSEHPLTATAIHNLGSLFRAQDNLIEARQHFERSLEIREKILGPEHLETGINLGNLGELLVALGDVEAGRVLLQRALQIFLAKLGSNHPSTQETLRLLSALGGGEQHALTLDDLAGMARTARTGDRLVGQEAWNIAGEMRADDDPITQAVGKALRDLLAGLPPEKALAPLPDGLRAAFLAALES